MDFKKIPLDLVKPSPMNPRKTLDEVAVKELSDNIEKQGLIQPITVRPREYYDYVDENGQIVSIPQDYEIVCGERRYRAFSLLKAKEDALNNISDKKQEHFQAIPAIVREMNDEDAFDAMITENLQRQDVDPMEEAFAFGQLIQKGKTAEEVAARFGKSVRFVQDRVKLNALIPELMLAVKDDKMSISSAMIICKLDEESQRKYHSQYSKNYQGLTKATAEDFVNALFMTIAKAPWYKSDNQADEDFDGGCGCACSECHLNTSNHGCLFWEMKNQNTGRCTNRAKFHSKLIAYMVKVVDDNADNLVKAGEPLEKGKTVIGLRLDDCWSESAKVVKTAFKTEVESKGYEVVDPISAFASRCWYEADDERTIEKLASGEVYRVLFVGGYDILELSEIFFYVNKNDTSINSQNGLPMQVNDLLRDYRKVNSEESINTSNTVAGCKAIGEHGQFKDLKGLDNAEFVLAYSLMMKNNSKLCIELGLGGRPTREEIRQYVASNLDKAPYILRSWIKHSLRFGSPIITLDEARSIAEPFVDRIGDLWCAAEYNAALKKVSEKREKEVKKIERQLNKLGYDIEGNKLSER